MIYTIDGTNRIIGHVSAEDAAVVSDAQQFTSEAELRELAAEWPAARLVEIWNGLPGVAGVKKFKDRQTGIARIWKAIQPAHQEAPEPIAEPETEAAPVHAETPEAEHAPDVAPEEGLATEKPTRAKKSPKVAQNANGARDGSKTATVLALLRREGGATGQELMEATGWQAHSVRGFLSGTLRKKMGIDVLSAKREDGTRFYVVS